MTDEMRVKAALPEAYQYATGRVHSERSVCAFLLGRSWEDAAGHHTVKRFWNGLALKIECHGAPHGDALIGDYCWEGNDVESRYICPERIAAAEAAWEKAYATEQGFVTNGKIGSISENMSPVGGDELSHLRKENEELKAAKINAEATVLEYRFVVDIICAHIQDRMNMKD